MEKQSPSCWRFLLHFSVFWLCSGIWKINTQSWHSNVIYIHSPLPSCGLIIILSNATVKNSVMFQTLQLSINSEILLPKIKSYPTSGTYHVSLIQKSALCETVCCAHWVLRNIEASKFSKKCPASKNKWVSGKNSIPSKLHNRKGRRVTTRYKTLQS